MINRIRTILNQEDISASKLAEKIGVNRASISHIMSERNKPSLEFIQKVLDSFPHINADWLLTGQGTYLKTKPTPSLKKTTDPTPKEPTKEPLKEASPPPITKDLFSPSLFSEIKKGSPKRAIRVITFYSDGTFEEFLKE